jgi:PEP-CTERM motif
MRSLYVLAATILTISGLAISALPVFADSFQIKISSSTEVSGANWDNDNFECWFTSGTSPYGCVGGWSGGTVSSHSFSLTPGDKITQASAIFYPETSVGTGTLGIGSGSYAHLPPDPNDPVSIPPTFGPATAWFYPDSSDFNPQVTFSGNHIQVDAFGVLTWYWMKADIVTPGYNWCGFIGGESSADLPYTLEVDGEYTVTPEPATFSLLGTALLGLAAKFGLRRRDKLA